MSLWSIPYFIPYIRLAGCPILTSSLNNPACKGSHNHGVTKVYIVKYNYYLRRLLMLKKFNDLLSANFNYTMTFISKYVHKFIPILTAKSKVRMSNL